MAHLWAKSSEKTGAPGKPLWDHTIEVCTQMNRYYRLWHYQWGGRDPVCIARVLAYASILHDLGKVHRDFQAMLRPGGRRFENRHELLSLGFLGWLDVLGPERPWLAAAVAFHHRGFVQLMSANKPFYLGDRFTATGSPARELAEGVRREDAALIEELLTISSVLLGECGWADFEPYPVASGSRESLLESIQEAVAAIRVLAGRFRLRQDHPGARPKPDWTEVRGAIQVRGLLINSDHVASFGPQEIRQEARSRDQVKTALGNRIREYASHQIKAGQQVGSCVLVAPTGSGKTEAGLLWAGRQAETGSRGRLYFLLPYQASMNAMQRRLIRDFSPDQADRPEVWNSAVSLVHGRSLRTLYERLLDRGYCPQNAARQASEQNDLARLQTAPVCVCSPFQLIRLLFTPRGVEALMASLMDGRLVLDEIHAYDVEVTALTLAAVKFLIDEMSVRAFLTTATLPKHLELAIQDALGTLPLVRPEADVMDRPPRHRLALLPFDSQSLAAERQILARAAEGSVLVVVNQVNRARRLYQSLSPQSADVRLLHSRFTYADRANREKEVVPRTGRILVATQAIEVSLDVSYDACYTELAPLESLLQRFGRCNRQGEHADGSQVFVFEHFPRDERKSELPYEAKHLCTVLETLRRFLAASADGRLAERQILDLINQSYPDELRTTLRNTIQQRSTEIKSSLIDRFEPWGISDASVISRLGEQWEKLFDGEEVIPVQLESRVAQEETWAGKVRHLVPISRRQYVRLQRERKIVRWNEEIGCAVADAGYDPDLGLDL